jgi:hypothetical protein
MPTKVMGTRKKVRKREKTGVCASVYRQYEQTLWGWGRKRRKRREKYYLFGFIIDHIRTKKIAKGEMSPAVAIVRKT